MRDLVKINILKSLNEAALDYKKHPQAISDLVDLILNQANDEFDKKIKLLKNIEKPVEVEKLDHRNFGKIRSPE